MYLDLNNKNKVEVINEINNLNDNDNVVFHFICESCDDEQVTYDMEVVDVLEIVELNKDLGDEIIMPLHCSCTNCGTRMVFLSLNNISGLETI